MAKQKELKVILEFGNEKPFKETAVKCVRILLLEHLKKK